MASAPVLDVAALLLPAPGESAAGTPMPLTMRQELETLRKEFEPHPDNPSLAPVPKKPDWPKIKRMAEEALINTSKDLETAFRLTEALVKLHGFAGLREGLHLLHELVAQCWDRLHPIPDEGEGMEVRAEHFTGSSNRKKAPAFPIPFARFRWSRSKVTATAIGTSSWRCRDRGRSPHQLSRAPIRQAPTWRRTWPSAPTRSINWSRSWRTSAPPDPPALTGLREAVNECRRYIDKVSAKHAPVAADAVLANGDPTGGPGAGTDKMHALTSREEAYRQLAHIANVLEQLEPHSPIPDLLRRAIELGKMPFRQLLHELVREPNLLAEVRREFGIKEAEST